MTILVVDDEQDIREILSDLLIDDGNTVRLAANGAEALDIVSKDKTIELILLDLMMPVLTGFQVLDIIKKDEHLKHIPVVLMSASFDHSNAALADRYQVSGVLAKPFSIKNLFTMIADEKTKLFKSKT